FAFGDTKDSTSDVLLTYKLQHPDVAGVLTSGVAPWPTMNGCAHISQARKAGRGSADRKRSGRRAPSSAGQRKSQRRHQLARLDARQPAHAAAGTCTRRATVVGCSGWGSVGTGSPASAR